MRHSSLFRVLLASLALVAVAACRAPEATSKAASEGAAPASAEGLKARVELASSPTLGVVPVVVYVLDGEDGVAGATVRVTGDMTHAGMAPVLSDAQETEPGLYRADGFAFTMAGDWIITADIELADGRKHRVETSVTVPGG